MLVLTMLIVAIVAYAIGSVPLGALIARTNNVDITRRGSGKMGMTNVLRTVGRRAAAVVLIGDLVKGSLAVLAGRALARLLMGQESTITLLNLSVPVVTLASLVAAVAVMSGHVWSLYLRLTQGEWRGGRGVVPALGAVLVVSPWIVVAAAVVGIPTVMISRYMSLGSILGAVSGGLTIILLVVLGELDTLSVLFVLLSIFIVVAHRDNIERLLNGTERKIGERANT